MNVNEDFNYAFALSRQCLRIFGVWPDPFTPLSDFHRPNIRFIIVTCILCLYVIVPQLTNMILAWGNVARMVKYIASANYGLMALCKLVGTWYHGKTLRTLMTSVVTDWMTSKNDRERNTMLNIARHGRILSFGCYVCTVCTISFYLSFNLRKFYRNMHQSQRTLVYGSAYPYNIHRSPNYEITYFTQLSGGIYTALINSTVDSFVSILLLHICAQLINLRTALNDLIDKLAEGFISSSRFKKGLAAITIRHEHLIRNAKTVDDCYTVVLFIHMFAATFQLCFVSFQVFTIISNHLDVPPAKVGFLSFYVIMSTSMAYGVYKSKWYDILSKDAKNLMFIVYRSTIPLRLTAGKFGVFSLAMFGTTVKTSMGYLSALLTMMD